MKLLIGAGGTGGHIIPALAIAKGMVVLSWEVEFIGNKDGMENTLIPAHGFPFHPIQVQKIYRKLTIAHLKFPAYFISSLLKCLSYIKKYKPEAVLCTGGFVSGPVALAAVMSKTRLYFQDGNSYPGLTTRLMARYSRCIFTATETASGYLYKGHCFKTGNPLMPYEKLNVESVDWAMLNLSPTSVKLFIIGGSQGSAVINNAIDHSIHELLRAGIELIWQTGKLHKEKFQDKYASTKGVHIFDFTDKMSFYYQITDLAVSRAGALSIAELEEHKIPAILIPLPSAAENHQLINAQTVAGQNKGIVLEQAQLSSAKLIETIVGLKTHLHFYQEQLERATPNQATAKICEIIIRDTKNRVDAKCCPECKQHPAKS